MTANNNLSRRSLVAGGAALGLAALAGTGLASASATEAAANEGPKRQLGFYVNTENCVNCQRCVRACAVS